jgi:predicted nucleic acid-binding Zn ribbon protein
MSVGASPRRPHRAAPRPLAVALGPLHERIQPATALARIQAAWADLAKVLPAAREGSATNYREGVLTVSCNASVWAHELQLSAEVVVDHLNAALREDLVTQLRTRTGATR